MSAGATGRVLPDMDGQARRSTRTPKVELSAGEKRASSDDGIAVLSYVLSGILFYGGLGFAGYHYLGQVWMLPVGLIIGLAASTFLIVKRYGSTTLSTDVRKEQECG